MKYHVCEGGISTDWKIIKSAIDMGTRYIKSSGIDEMEVCDGVLCLGL